MPLGGIRGIGGDHLKAHLGSLRSTDFLNHLVEFHVDDILEGLFPLGHGGDPVVWLEPAILVGGASGNDFHDLGVAIVRPEHGTDPDQGEAHLDVEVLHVGGTHVLGVRVVTLGKRHEECPHHILVALLVHALEELVVTFRHHFGRRIKRMLVQVLLQEFRLDAVGPELVGLLDGGGPGGLFPIDLDGLVTGEVMRCGSQGLVLGNTVLHALAEPREDLARSAQVTVQDLGGECRGESLEKLVHITLCEVEMHVIKHPKVILQDALGHRLRRFRIQPGGILFREGERMQVMALLKHPGDRGRDGRHVRGDGIGVGTERKPRRDHQEQQCPENTG